MMAAFLFAQPTVTSAFAVQPGLSTPEFSPHLVAHRGIRADRVCLGAPLRHLAVGARILLHEGTNPTEQRHHGC